MNFIFICIFLNSIVLKIFVKEIHTFFSYSDTSLVIKNSYLGIICGAILYYSESMLSYSIDLLRTFLNLNLLYDMFQVKKCKILGEKRAMFYDCCYFRSG